MRGQRRDGWVQNDQRIAALAVKLEGVCADEHQADVLGACLVLVAGVIVKNSGCAEDKVAGVGAVADQLFANIRKLGAH